MKEEKWYSMGTEEVLGELGTDANSGLTDERAKRNLEEFGENELPKPKKKHVLIRFFRHFNDILIYILLIAALVSGLLGHYVDTIVIALVAVINAVIGFVQENKAEKAIADIRKLMSLRAAIMRGGRRMEIDARNVTVGDIVLLNPGDRVPADLRLAAVGNLRIDESPLTGESVPVEKITAALPADTMLGDRRNMAFSGTTVSSGTGAGVVVGVGVDTEIGRINELICDIKPLATPLLKQTARFGKTVSFVILGIALATYVFGRVFRDYDPQELLLSVIGLAVAAIPEGLPAMLSVILAIGVRNMVRRNAIIRSLPSVETLGSVSVICSDKTGTLTKNEMTVQTLATRDDVFRVSGTGYAPEGDITLGGEKVDLGRHRTLADLIECFYYCNDAVLDVDEEGHWNIKGDPTEGALITLFEKSRLPKLTVRRLHAIPFDSAYKYMAVLVEAGGERLIFIKGAPDCLLDMACCERAESGEEPFNRRCWDDLMSRVACAGQRLIGAAYKHVDKSVAEITHADVESDIVFLGLAGIMDPPREEAVEAVGLCQQAGIRVKMITGDHAETAQAIGAAMGIGDGTKALQGRDLDGMDDERLAEAVREYDVFARTSPEHKLRLVNAIQSGGEICAMTGDGVNDAPALKKADMGIAMGIKGTEVTKDSAEMVLADDNFSTIAAAVQEGRRVYDNLKKTILFILPTNGAQSLLIVAAILLGMAMPLTPVQILWVNMVTSVTISLALAFEHVEPDAMHRPPRPPRAPLLNGYFVWRILFVSLLMGGGTLWINFHLHNQGVPFLIVNTVTIQTIVFAQLFHLFNSRSIRKFAIGRDFFSNRSVFAVSAVLIALQLAMTYLPFMNRIFGTYPIGARYWIYPLALGAAVFFIVEIEKIVMNRLKLAKL